MPFWARERPSARRKPKRQIRQPQGKRPFRRNPHPCCPRGSAMTGAATGPRGTGSPRVTSPGKKSPERKPQDAACFRESLFPAGRCSPERAFPAAPWQGISLLRPPRTAVSGGTTAVSREITGDRRGREPDLRKINLLRGTGSPNPKRINRRKTGSSPLRGPRERLPKRNGGLTTARAASPAVRINPGSPRHKPSIQPVFCGEPAFL